MKYGLRKEDLDYIITNIEKYSEIDKAILFGSRVMGNYKNGSDIDIAIIGDDITFDTVASLHYKLEEEGPMPYFIDIIDYTHLNHKDLKNHIDRVGAVIYEKDN